MQFRAQDYYKAGLERMQQAHKLCQQGESFALAMYCGGLAVECLLRAFRWEEDRGFEGRHDLSELLAASRLLRIDEDYMRRRHASEDAIRNAGQSLRGAMNEVVSVWHNNLRFASEARLRAFLKQINRLHGVKGDPCKKNALDLLSAAQSVINRGIALWTSKTRS